MSAHPPMLNPDGNPLRPTWIEIVDTRGGY